MSRRVRKPTERGTPKVVVAATLLVATMAAAWSVVLPVGEGPDEPAHLGLVFHLADGHPYPSYDSLRRTEALARMCETFVASVRVCPLPGEEVTADAVRVRRSEDAPPRSRRPAFDDDGGDVAVTELNQMPQHPPLYYEAMALALQAARKVVGGPMSVDRELALLRLLNVLLVVPVPVLAWLTARRLGGTAQLCVAAALFASALPMLAATGGVLNNDNLLTLLGAAAAPLLASLAMGDTSRRTVVGAGAVIGLALLTKAFAVVLVPTLALACWVGARSSATKRDGTSRRSPADVGVGLRRAVVPVAGAGAIAALVSGWWYVKTWRRAGSPTPSVDADRYTAALRPPGFSPDVVHFADVFAGRFAERFWGSFGWYSARLPGWVTVVLTVASVVLLVAGFFMHRGWRAPMAVLAVPSLLLLVLTASRAWTLHERSGQYPFIQGRYLLAGLVGLAVPAAAGWVGLVRWRRSTAVLAAVAVAVQVGALSRGLTAYWAGGVGGRLRAVDAWSGLPAGVAVVLLVASAVAAIGLLVVAAMDGETPERDGEASRRPASPMGADGLAVADGERSSPLGDHRGPCGSPLPSASP